MTDPAKYSDAEIAQMDAEAESDIMQPFLEEAERRAAEKAEKERQLRRKTIMLTLFGVGGVMLLAGAMALYTFMHPPATKRTDSGCGAVGCDDMVLGPRLTVPSPGAIMGLPTGGVQQRRDYDPVIDATVLTDSPVDAVGKLAAAFKPKAGKRYKVEVKVTQDE